MLPKRHNRGTVSYRKGERVPKDWGIVTEGIRKVKSGGLKELEFGGTTPCISGRGVGVD